MLALAAITMANSLISAQLRDFNAYAIVDQDINYTIVGGRFSPTISTDLTSQVVVLSVAGANDFRLALPADAFTTTGLGGYVASVISSLYKTDILLQPFSHGDWAYSAGIEGFVPGSTSVTVSLTIGGQDGRVSVEAYAFQPNAEGLEGWAISEQIARA